jgi:hypothetical protein
MFFRSAGATALTQIKVRRSGGRIGRGRAKHTRGRRRQPRALQQATATARRIGALCFDFARGRRGPARCG